MIGILIVAHGSLADSLVDCATHVLGRVPEHLATLDFIGHADPDEREQVLQRRLAELDEGDGILVLTDVYGATPSNTLCRLLDPAHVEGIAGVNLPMLIKALNYRERFPLNELIAKVVDGGHDGIHHIDEAMCDAATGH